MLASTCPRVLLVDDDTSSAHLLSDSLARQHVFELQHVRTLEEAETSARDQAFETALLSLSLRDHPGLIAVTLLQSFLPDTPIIAISNADSEAIALKAVHHGCADYLVRSQTYDTVLVRSIKHAIEANRARRALSDSEARYRALFEQSRDAIFIADSEARTIDANHALEDLLGCDFNQIVNQPIDAFFADPQDRILLAQDRAAKRVVTDLEVRIRRRDGRFLWCLMSMAERQDGDGSCAGYQGIIHDITERKRAEQRLVYNAYHDVLTGLPNRALFVDRLDRALLRWKRHRDHPFAVLFVDLNRFKMVNDSLGHAAGDELLTKVGELLRHCVRDDDTVARLGGDEFAVLIDYIEGEMDAVLVAQRIHTVMATPISIGGQDIFTSCSIGIALATSEGEQAEDLLRNADLAMYRSKGEAPGHATVYQVGMHSDALTLMALHSELHTAVRDSEFVLHYQPIYSLADGSLSGFEALLRWQNPRRGLMLPQEFLPLAEETGLIMPIGEWAIRSACEQLAAWRRRFGSRRLPFVSLNISSKQLAQSGFVAQTAAIIREAHVDPADLMLELTESCLLQNPESCANTVTKLRRIGVHFCIDDFGTGYSSLSYLHRLPINGLKIDRSFISGLDRGEGEALVSSVVALAHNLGIYAVAEGVENEAQLASVRALGPKYVQGYFLSHPLDPADAVRAVAI